MRISAIMIMLVMAVSLFGQEESLNLEERELPLEETFEPGTMVVVIIDYENHSIVEYINESDSEARITFNVSENGNPLPEERIGPVRFRTKTLEPGKKVQMTHNWEKGHEVSFEITGGETHIVVKPEKKII